MTMPTAQADLHCHTNLSDGQLTPAALLELALARKLDWLAITDHDCDAAFDELEQPRDSTLRLITGAEFSTRWRSHEVHIVALNYARQEPLMKRLFAAQTSARQSRNARIAERLQTLGLDSALEEIASRWSPRQISRVHFADLLVARGYAKSSAQAFKRFLGQGGRAWSSTEWTPIERICATVGRAGGVTIIAHPTKYRMTHAKLSLFVAEFAECGGDGLEVVNGRPAPAQREQLARLCARHGLLASVGSDFHRPNESWADLGRCAALPHSCVPVWTNWD